VPTPATAVLIARRSGVRRSGARRRTVDRDGV